MSIQLTEISYDFMVYGNTREELEERARKKADDMLGENCTIDRVDISYNVGPPFDKTYKASVSSLTQKTI